MPEPNTDLAYWVEAFDTSEKLQKLFKNYNYLFPAFSDKMSLQLEL
jgi:hypothetical protein